MARLILAMITPTHIIIRKYRGARLCRLCLGHERGDTRLYHFPPSHQSGDTGTVFCAVQRFSVIWDSGARWTGTVLEYYTGTCDQTTFVNTAATGIAYRQNPASFAQS